MRTFLVVVALAFGFGVGCGGSVDDPAQEKKEKSYSELGASIAQACQEDPDCMLACDTRPGIKLHCEETCYNECQMVVGGACYSECQVVTGTVDGQSAVLDEQCFETCGEVEILNCQSACFKYCEGSTSWVTHSEWTEER